MGHLRVISLFLIAFMLCIGSASYVTEEERRAQDYLQQVNEEYVLQFQAAKDIIWTPKDELTIEEMIIAMIGLSETKNLTIAVAQNLRQYNTDHFQNEDLKRHIKLLKNLRTNALDLHDFFELTDALDTMKNYSTVRSLCSYQHRTKCDSALLPHVRGVFTTSQDPTELQYYWTQWRDKFGPLGKIQLEKYQKLYAKSASLNGFAKPSHQWYSEYDNPNFLEDLTHVWRQLRPLYQEMHAYIRSVLRDSYGKAVVPDNGPIGQHFMEQILLQAWKKDSLLEHPHPEKHLPNLKEQLENQEYTALKIVEVADEFFRSLGLSELPESFWSKYNRQIPNAEAGPDCKAEVFDFFPDVALKYCPKPYFKKFLQMHGDMAAIHYNVEKNHLPFRLRDEACPGFSKALGEAATLSASSPKHIERINLLTNYHYDDDLKMNRLFRFGVHTLLQIPSYYVHEKLWVDILDGNVNIDNANCKYWEYMEEFMGVQPPVQRSNRDFDVSYRFYEGLQEHKPHSTKIMSEVLGYQFYKGLCEKSALEGNIVDPLHNCDFYGSHGAGRALKEIMSYGSRKPWHEIIGSLTGTNKLDAGGLIAFYEPLFLWLRDQNTRNNVNVGWQISHRCSRG